MKAGFLMIWAGLALAPPLAAEQDETLIEQQRSLFRELYPKAERGEWSDVAPHVPLLRNYPLYPDLRAIYLRSQLDEHADDEVRRFLLDHPDTGATRDLRYRWAKSLAEREKWKEFIRLYMDHYADANDATLDCLALTARVHTGKTRVLADEAIELWSAGHEQPDECDPAFEYLAQTGYLSPELYRLRLERAIEARSFGLAVALSKKLGDEERRRAARWKAMSADPAAELGSFVPFEDAEENRRILLYGMQRLARLDPLKAHELWPALAAKYSFSREWHHQMPAEIALSAAREHKPEGRQWLRELSPRSRNDTTESWRARLAAREGDWAEVLTAIGNMSDAEAKRETWRYWSARAHEARGRDDLASQIYMAISEERSYYGFLASDRLGIAYEFRNRPARADELMIAQLASRPELIRARELFLVGLDSRGRSEWERAMAWLTPDEKAQAALLAHRWGWHSRAIAAAPRGDLLDDLEIRFPLPYWDVFQANARRNRISPTWALGIARSESLFMADVRSRAGAIGLMQLMPATGRSTAKRAKIRYHGLSSLLVPDTNIALGTHYLGSMLGRFANNQVLATAAYNAGPSRVDSWLPRDRHMEADQWVDSIPFQETREYVQRVFASEAIYHWRITGSIKRLSSLMPPVQPQPDKALVAKRSTTE